MMNLQLCVPAKTEFTVKTSKLCLNARFLKSPTVSGSSSKWSYVE